MVRPLVVGVVERRLTLTVKGNLRYWFFNSRWRCESTPDTDQEFDQVRLRAFQGIPFANVFHSIIFCEVVAIYGVVRS